MLDIKFIREHAQIVKDAARKKGVNIDIDKLLQLDAQRLILLSRVEDMRAQQNTVSSSIATEADPAKKQATVSAMQELKAQLKNQEEQLRTVSEEWKQIMLRVPNIPDISVPEGKDDSENVPIKHWGEKPEFSFAPQDHIELMTGLDMVDFDRGTKVHGFRGYFLKNDGALLSFAIWNYAMKFFMDRGFPTPLIAPCVVRQENFYGTGHLPSGADDLYVTQDDDYLSGTAEVPVTGYYRDEILEESDLPVKFLAFSPCYRREAGSHGKDTKGLIRVHEFYKVEQVILAKADHQETVALHEYLNENTEAFIQSLGIPYRVVNACTGDLGQGHVKMHDIELWVPSQGTYREISSASYYHDFQARRFNVRYRDKNGDIKFVYTLNCTAAPTPRLLVSLVENFQQADGSVRVPEVLQPYLGKAVLGVRQ